MDTNNLPVPAGPAEWAALDRLTGPEIQRAEQLARDFQPGAGTSILEFGLAPQKQLADLADPILRQVRAKDAGPATEPLTRLMGCVRELDADSLIVGGESFLAGLPLIGRAFRRIRGFIARYEKVATKIDRLTDELKHVRQSLLQDVSRLDRLAEQNQAALRETLIAVRAGEIKLDELTADLDGLRAEAAATGNPSTARRAQDLAGLIARLERRIHDLKLTAVIAYQLAPQIRLVQAGDQALIEKIQSSILTTIPLWKNQIVLAISLFNQQKALRLQRAVTDTTNQILARNAQLLQQGTTEIARESERGIVEIATLQEVNDRLIATIEETIEIQAEGRRRRGEAEGQLHQMHVQLQAALAGSRGPMGDPAIDRPGG